METLNTLLLMSHIAGGFIALSLFWVQAAKRKGGAQHRLLGNYYVKLMWLVVISAVLLCIMRILEGRLVIAIFLLFIALITAKPLWMGTAVLDARKGETGLYRRVNVAFNVAIVVAGAGMIGYGLHLGGQGFAVLLMIFGGLGLSNVFDLWASVKALGSSDTSDWMKEHIVGMGISGIAAHTAFLVFGANRFLPEAITQSYWSFVPWLAPTVVGTVLIRIAVNKYQPKPRTAVA